jgi:hypothetical protein
VDKALLSVLGLVSLTLTPALACGGSGDDPPTAPPPPGDAILSQASADTRNDIGVATWGFGTDAESGTAVFHGYNARNERLVEVRQTVASVDAHGVRVSTTMKGSLATGSEKIQFGLVPAPDGQTATASIRVVQNTFAGGGVAARVLAHLKADVSAMPSDGTQNGTSTGLSLSTSTHPLDTLVNGPTDPLVVADDGGCNPGNPNMNQNGCCNPGNPNMNQNRCQNQWGSPSSNGMWGNPAPYGIWGNPASSGLWGNPGSYGMWGNPGSYGMGGNPGSYALWSCAQLPQALGPLFSAILPVLGEIAKVIAGEMSGIDAGGISGIDAAALAAAFPDGGITSATDLWAFVTAVANAVAGALAGTGADAGLAKVLGDILDASSAMGSSPAAMGSAIYPLMSCLMGLLSQAQANQNLQNCLQQQPPECNVP